MEAVVGMCRMLTVCLQSLLRIDNCAIVAQMRELGLQLGEVGEGGK